MLRAAATIVREHGRDAVPERCRGCQWWDGRFEECRVRLASMVPAGELLLDALHARGLTDAGIAGLMGVGRSAVSRWHHGRDRIPEGRARELGRLLGRLEAGDEDLGLIVGENKQYMREAQTRRIRHLLGILRNYGCKNADVARYLGLSRATVSKWKHGYRIPDGTRFEALEDLLEEKRAERRHFAVPIDGGL